MAEAEESAEVFHCPEGPAVLVHIEAIHEQYVAILREFGLRSLNDLCCDLHTEALIGRGEWKPRG